MLIYNAQTFSALHDFEVAKDELEVHREKLPALGSVIRKHGVHNSVGISLLHKHFELLDYERLVEGFAGEKRCCRATAVHDDNDTTPYMWKVNASQSGEWTYQPMTNG